MGEPTFGVLGPLQVKAHGVPVRIGGAKPRAVLATLLLQPNGFVSLDLLTEVLWPGGAPRSAVANVRTYVRTLRGLLPSGAVGGLRTEPAGYSLDVAPGELDMTCFEQRLAAARAARDRGEDATALRGYESALGLWRGGVLQDVPSSVVWDPAVARMDGLRSVAADECLDLRLRLGDYAHLVSGLRSRLAESPLREDLWRMLVHALHDAGRGAEARSAYAEAERVIAAELGIAPSAPLRAIGAEVNGYTGRRRPAPPAPARQLPMDIPDFTGRAVEVADLEALLSTAGRQPVVAAVSGPPGPGSRRWSSMSPTGYVTRSPTVSSSSTWPGRANAPARRRTSWRRCCADSGSSTARSPVSRANVPRCSAPGWRSGASSSCSTTPWGARR